MLDRFRIKEKEPMKLDWKDKKILEQLCTNSRMSVAQIARKVKMPKDSVLYRVKRLEKSDLIQYVAIINPLMLGYPIFKFVHLTLRNFDSNQEEKLVAYMTQHKNIVYVAKTSGRYDYLIAISAKNLIDFDNIFGSLRSKFSDIIGQHETADIINEYKYEFMAGLVGEKIDK